ncbi:MAG: hypothetical protein OXD32_02720 [Endozoicomonadaceae bacterium]|nr:hypothetical protein [Endozoicomonadaceae bacterium]
MWRVANRLFTGILCIFCIYTLFITANAVTEKIENVPLTVSKVPNPYDYLRQHSELPVDFLFSVYQAAEDFQKKIPTVLHPFFSTLQYVKQGNTHIMTAINFYNLTDRISHLKGIEYIEKKQFIPISEIPLYDWLIREYGAFHYIDNHTPVLLMLTIEGMLFDLERRQSNGDEVSALVLKFLKRPHANATAATLTDNTPWFYRWMKSLQTLFTQPKEFSFSEQLAMLTDSPHTDESNRIKRFYDLKERGYQYQNNYTFSSYEADEDRRTQRDVPNDIVQTDEEVKEILDAEYSLLTNSADGSDLSDSLSPANTSKSTTLFTGSALKKTCGIAFAAICFFSMINSGLALNRPPRSHTSEDVCNPQNCNLLSNLNFTTSLRNNVDGCFKLAENITLNSPPYLLAPVNCESIFSGVLETGNYTIHAGNGTLPFFPCISQAKISGNVNLCAATQAHNQPVIARTVLNSNTIAIKQTGKCNTQRPLLDQIIGDYNQISFNGNSINVTVAANSGVVANSVSGSNNTITAENAQLLNAPLVSMSEGFHNTYHQKNMNITRYTKNYLTDTQFLVADQLTGSNTVIRQHNIDATFITPSVPDINTLNRNISKTERGRTTVFSSDAIIRVSSPEDTVRITNISDHTQVWSAIKNNGYFEIYRNGLWETVCEDTLNEKTAHVACKSMGFLRAESEGHRLRLKEVLPPVKLNTTLVHANKNCTGYEQHLSQCNTINTHRGPCLQNEAALLSCSNEKIVKNSSFMLTDPYSDRPDRFDTTNRGWGRLEVRDISRAVSLGSYGPGVGDIHSVCGRGFNNDSAIIACNILGYDTGYVSPVQPIPLPDSVPILSLDWRCNARNIGSLFSCSLRNGNLIDYDCTHNDDVVVSCNERLAQHYSVRLTDRHSNDKHRADTTTTGFGRLEVHNRFYRNFSAVCPENVNDEVANAACRQRGFSNGSFSHLSIKPVSLSFYNSSQLQLNCSANQNSLRAECSKHFVNNSNCTQPEKNVLLLCNDGETTYPQTLTKPCLSSGHRPNTHILFSGNFNWKPTGCEFNRCPVKFWDADGTEVSDIFKQQCNGTQQLHTTNREHWLKMWNNLCNTRTNNCSCHLPHEQLLGLVAHGNNTLSVSRQSYPYNTSTNAQGIIRISTLFSDKAPQILSTANETLVTGTLPVSQIITEQHLVGLYSGEHENKQAQLFWASLAENSTVYHVQPLPVTGEPLLLTNNSVFIKDTTNATIVQYPLNTMQSNDNSTIFTIDSSPDQYIDFPENTVNIIAATAKNQWLYVTTTNDSNSDQIYVRRYNTEAKLWDDWQQIHTISNNDRIVINDDDQVQFLSTGQTLSTYPGLISIPDEGGCTLFSNIIPDTTTILTPCLDPTSSGSDPTSSGSEPTFFGSAPTLSGSQPDKPTFFKKHREAFHYVGLGYLFYVSVGFFAFPVVYKLFYSDKCACLNRAHDSLAEGTNDGASLEECTNVNTTKDQSIPESSNYDETEV